MKSLLPLLVLTALVATGCTTHRVQRSYEENTTTVETQLPDGSVDRVGGDDQPGRRVVIEETVSAAEIVVE